MDNQDNRNIELLYEQYVNFKINQAPDEEFDPEQLRVGIEVEREHHNDDEIAKSIAKDHLQEDKDYYVKLKESNL